MRIHFAFAWSSTLVLVLALAPVACGSNHLDPVVVIVDDDASVDALDGASDVSSDGPVDALGDGPTDTAPTSDGAPPACVKAPPPGAAPAPRSDAVGALSPDRQLLLVYGGDTAAAACGDAPANTYASDTWLLDVGCGAWRKVDGGASTPGARAEAAMATDLAGGRALLFGGHARSDATAPFTLFGDVWAFDFKSEAWSKVATSGSGPAARVGASMVVSKKLGKAYLFGGSTSDTGVAAKNDTWSLDLKTGEWATVAAGASTLPGARAFHAAALDDAAGVLYVYGGGDDGALAGPYFPDLWALDLHTETWARVEATSLPPARIGHAMTWDSIGKRLVVFGGHDDGALGDENDVWTLDPKSTAPTWSKVALGDTLSKPATGVCKLPPDHTTIDKASPERRTAFALGVRDDGHAFVLWGGKGDCGVLADAWWYDVAASKWTTTVKSPIGLSCLRYSTTCSGLCG